MPRPPIDEHWQRRVREIHEAYPKLSSRRIYTRLEEEGQQLQRDDWPSEKSIRNILAAHRNASEQERRQYRQAWWPESFGTPELPWESSRAVLGFVRFCDERQIPHPTVRQAKWYWRLHLAAPGMPMLEAAELAGALSGVESARNLGSEATSPNLTHYLAYAPWQGAQDQEAWQSAAERLGLHSLGHVSITGDRRALAAYVREVFGMSEEQARELADFGEEEPKE